MKYFYTGLGFFFLAVGIIGIVERFSLIVLSEIDLHNFYFDAFYINVASRVLFHSELDWQKCYYYRVID